MGTKFIDRPKSKVIDLEDVEIVFLRKVNLEKTKDPNRVFSMILVEEMIYAAGKQITQAKLKAIMANVNERSFTEEKFREILSSQGFFNKLFCVCN